MGATDPVPRGRRPGVSNTREDILRAAREVFSEKGFDGATVRAIARRAGVDPALVIRVFSSKDGLFAHAVGLPFDARAVIAGLRDGPLEALGERLAATFLSLWSDAETGPQLLGLLRSAATHEAAVVRLRELVDAQLLTPLADSLGSGDARLRAQLAAAQLVGLAYTRHMLELEPIASAPPETLASMLAPTLQRYLTGELEPHVT